MTTATIDARFAPRGMTLARVAERIINRPLLLDPRKGAVLLWALGGRIGVDEGTFAPPPEASRFVGKMDGLAGQYGVRQQDGVAIVSIVGSLVNRGAWVGASSGLTSYEGVAAQLDAAVADPSIRAIVLDIESPGGEATGMYGLAERIRAINAQKPVVAMVNDMAASAGYGLASAAGEIVVSPTSIVGSIGVLLMHFDYSGAFQEAGIKPTLIFAGAHKVDGNPYAPLSDAVAADLKQEVDTFYARFLESVAAGRPSLGVEGARATQARTFIGADAVAAGLADRVGTLDDVIRSYSTAPMRASAKGGRMTQNNGSPAPEAGSVSQAQHEAAVASARTAALAEGRKAERDRVAAVLADDKAKGKERAILDLAVKYPDMAVADIIGIVADSGAGGHKTIDERMAGQGEQLAIRPVAPAGTRGESGWAKAVNKQNARTARR